LIYTYIILNNNEDSRRTQKPQLRGAFQPQLPSNIKWSCCR